MSVDVSWASRLRAANRAAALKEAFPGSTGVTKDESLAIRKAEKILKTADGAIDKFETHAHDSTGYHQRGMISSNYPQLKEESGLINPDIVWDEFQTSAIKKLAKSQYAALIGAAGTGKTTLVKALLAGIIYGDEELGLDPIGIRDIDEKAGPSIALCAFTGIASQVIRKNLPDWAAPACKTIHTLLEYSPENFEYNDEVTGELKVGTHFVPTRDASRPLEQDVIVIDEASMLGLNLWHQILDACRPNTKIILIGDINQLKPVADQTMFAYALAESLQPDSPWVVAELKKIHRQKEPEANRIIDTAHEILSGKRPTFDDPNSPNWRVIGFKLDNSPTKAAQQIVGFTHMLTTKKGPDGQVIYDPHRDRIMTAGNGEDMNQSSSAVQQITINETLCRLVDPPSEDHPVTIIDAGRVERRFCVGHRVMATKNEPPDQKDRVTNGMTGRVLEIEKNPKWQGEHGLVGSEASVKEFRRQAAQRTIAQMKGEKAESKMFELGDVANFVTQAIDNKDTKEERVGDQPASHIVTVKFDNGATRRFGTKSQVESLCLAYATTVHKAQGSQCDTAIIVCHHAVKMQLNREWLYTGWTRAVRRVICLYTDLGIATAVSKQQIYGKTTAEKIQRYAEVMARGDKIVKLTI